MVRTEPLDNVVNVRWHVILNLKLDPRLLVNETERPCRASGNWLLSDNGLLRSCDLLRPNPSVTYTLGVCLPGQLWRIQPGRQHTLA